MKIFKRLENAKWLEWFKESNRDSHFKGGLITAFLGTILFTLGLSMGMEYKDKLNGGKFDWNDIKATLYGGLVGQLLQIILIIILILLI